MQLFNLELSPSNMAFMSEVALHRAGLALRGQKNPSTAPYISGDGIRQLADFRFDKDEQFDPTHVRARQVIFVGFDRLEEFFATVHSRISQQYILVTHNGDTTMDERFVRHLDARIAHWFSQNVGVSHPKLTPLPIGIENLDYYNHGVPAIFESIKETQSAKRDARILYGFSISTNPLVREKAFRQLQRMPTASAIPQRLNARAYFHYLSGSMFVASPEGHGLDCHRTWEALYLGVVPIVQRSVGMEYFSRLGMPIWIIDDWAELKDLTPSDLAERYHHAQSKFRTKTLQLSYWKEKIDAYRR